MLIKKSTTDAILELQRRVRNEHKYTAAIFLDIKGAFNNVWWPSILYSLRRKNVPRDVYDIIKDYFRDRKVTYRVGTATEERSLQRGCPQGSKLGPGLWNVVVDLLLDEIENIEDTHTIAYADDIAVVTWGNSRPRLENRFDAILRCLDEWALGNKLQFSLDKSVYMVFGKTKLTRNPVARLGNGRISRVKEAKYLGVTIDEGWTFQKHFLLCCKKAKNLFMSLRRALGSVATLPSSALRRIFYGAVLPIFTYACQAFVDKINLVRSKNKFNSVRGVITAHN